jgi:hypothetical protein
MYLFIIQLFNQFVLYSFLDKLYFLDFLIVLDFICFFDFFRFF